MRYNNPDLHPASDSCSRFIRFILCIFVPLFSSSTQAQESAVTVGHMVSTNSDGYVKLPPSTSAPLAGCPQFPGTDAARSRVLAPAYENFPVEFEFRGKPKTHVFVYAPKKAPGYLTFNPNIPRTENSMDGWTDENGSFKFYFVVRKQAAPIEKPIVFEVGANEEHSMSGQSAEVQVGLGLEIDITKSKLIPVSFYDDTTHSAAWFIAWKSRFHENFDYSEYFDNVLNCKVPEMGLPLVIADVYWSGVNASAVGLSYLSPALPTVHGPRFLNPANGLGATFGSHQLPRFDFQTQGNHLARLVKGTTVVVARDSWNKRTRELGAPTDSFSFEPPFFPKGFFLVSPFEQIESVSESAACALESSSENQRVVLAALEAIPRFGQVPSAIGHIMSSLCQFAHGNDVEALRVLFNAGLKEGAEWLVFDHFTPQSLRAWNSQQQGELKMNDAQIDEVCALIQSAYKSVLAGGQALTRTSPKTNPEPPVPANSLAEPAEPALLHETSEQSPPIHEEPIAKHKQVPSRVELKESVKRTQELQKELEQAGRSGKKTSEILDKLSKELEEFERLSEAGE